MTDHKALIAEARGWADKIGNPFDRGEMTNAELIRAMDVFESAFDALEVATAERAVVEAQALERVIERYRSNAGGFIYWLEGELAEIRKGRQ